VSKRVRLAVKITMAIVSLVGLVLFALYYAIHNVPEFYEEAASVSLDAQQEARDEMEHRALDLHNRARRIGRWSMTFETQQINGWLAAGMPESFPDLLPAEVHAPRVAIETQQLCLAFQYDDQRISTVVNLTLDVNLTDEENTVAIRVRSARAGLIPLPLKDFLGQISSAARDANLELRWATAHDDPVALITIPSEFPAFKNKHVRIDTIELRQGEVYLAGTTSSLDDDE